MPETKAPYLVLENVMRIDPREGNISGVGSSSVEVGQLSTIRLGTIITSLSGRCLELGSCVQVRYFRYERSVLYALQGCLRYLPRG